MTVEAALLAMAEAADDDLGHLLRRAARVVDLRVAAAIAASGAQGVRPAHGVVLSNLDPGGTRVTTLADRGGMSRQAMSSLVKELEDAGYLRTEPDPTDGRAVRVTLTEAGVELCRGSAAAVRQIEAGWAEVVGAAGLVELRRALRALAATAS